MDAIKKYIDEYLKKSFIRPSFLVAVVLVLLIRKSGSKLRFRIIYRALNKITIKN